VSERRFGIHASTAGGVDRAAQEALDVGANCFQMFSSSPRMWRASPIDPAKARALRQQCEKHDLAPVVIHCNYLINLASTDENVLRQSIGAFRGELERAVQLGAQYVVLHPGSRKGHTDPQAALDLAAASVGVASQGLRMESTRLLFENTAGAGQSIGSVFEDLATLKQLVARTAPHVPVGFCIDTCHCLAAGYDIVNDLDHVVRQLDHLLGLDNIPVIHTNDSKGALGSHLDRHANIGDGQIGEAAFARILNHADLRTKAFILETPSEDGAAARDLATLRRLTSPSE
jgi:deoxyribonuclease IV